MEFDQVIKSRRSIRQYKDKMISDEDLQSIFDAARLGETWKNSQTPRYYVIKSPEKLKTFKETCLAPFNAKNCANAPVLVVTTFVKNRSGFERNGSPSNELGNGWGIYDTGLCNQNMILKAQDLGLGTLVMGIRDEKAIRNLLEVPVDEMIVSVISIGYPDIEPEMPKRKELADIVKYY